MSKPPKRSRRAREVLHVFTEGEVTEPEYLDWVKRGQSRFALVVDDRHGPPRKLLELALATSRRWNTSEWGPRSDRSIWCVFDRDQHGSVDDVIRRAEQAGIRVAFSHPCFEYWLLLHFCDEAAPGAGDCAGVARRLERHVVGYRKSFPMTRLEGRYVDGRARAQRVLAQHDRDGLVLPTQRDPSTNVWELVDQLGVTY
jgi:hypothetical protein